MSVYTVLLVKHSLLFHRMQFCLFSYNIKATHKFTKCFHQFLEIPGWLQCLLTALIDYIMRGRDQEVSLKCKIFFVCKIHAVTTGAETWQVVTQISYVALTFEFRFLFALFRTLLCVSALVTGLHLVR
jgi:hypothetical protein